MLKGQGIRFSLGFENLKYDKMYAKLKEDLISFSQDYDLEFGVYEDHILYIDGEVIKETRKEVKAEFTSIKKELRKLLKQQDKTIRLTENMTITFNRI